MAELFPTPIRLRTAREIAAGRVKTYLWSNQAWIQDDTGGEESVTRHANELLRAELARKPNPLYHGAKIPLELTDAGRQWLADAEKLAAEQRREPLGPPQPVICAGCNKRLRFCVCLPIPERAS